MRKFIDLVESPTKAMLQAWDALMTEFNAAQDYAHTYGIRWEHDGWWITLTPEGATQILLDDIQVRDSNNGQGTKLMKLLCGLADSFRVTIVLQADETNDGIGEEPDDDEYDERQHWLQDWYMSLGFEYDQVRGAGDYGPYMIREPR
jgi:hypothetical protein